MLRDLAAEEDLLFLLAEGQRTEAAHAVLADHAAGEVGGDSQYRCPRRWTSG